MHPGKKPPLISIELPAECIEVCPKAQRCIRDPYDYGVIALVNSVVSIDPDSDLTFVGKVACPGYTEHKVGRIRKKLEGVCNIDVSCVTFHDDGSDKTGEIADMFRER